MNNVRKGSNVMSVFFCVLNEEVDLSLLIPCGTVMGGNALPVSTGTVLPLLPWTFGSFWTYYLS